MDMTNRRQQKTLKDDGTRFSLLNRGGYGVPACTQHVAACRTVADQAVMSARLRPSKVPGRQHAPVRIALARTPRL